MSRRRLIALVIALGLAVGLALALRAFRAPEIEVSYAPATTGSVVREVLTTGTIEPAGEVEAGTQVSGTVQSLYADFNSQVKAGQIVAQLDPSVYDTQLAQARAALIQAEADAQRARIEADDLDAKAARARELAARDLVTQAQLDEAVLAAKEASAEVVAARAAARAANAMLAQARINRDHTTIRSPIDGIVVSRNVEVGQTLAASLESPILFRIADLRRMRLLADISEAEVGGVQPGTPVTFEIESLGPYQFNGTVREVRLQPIVQQTAPTPGTSGPAAPAARGAPTTPAPAASESRGTTGGAAVAQPTPAVGSTTTQSGGGQSGSTSGPAAPAGAVISYTAVVDVDNPAARIPPGSTAIVTLPTTRRWNVVRIPNTALSFRPSASILESTRQQSLELPSPDTETDPTSGRQAIVWKYERGKFVPIEVRVGIADERWTELLAGNVQAGDLLVTQAR
jgi:RND family efflux transporter MFP subunit